jgi:hypothetical protein
VREDAPPLLIVTGDRELELLGRYEENAYLWRMMNVVGHKYTKLHELKGSDQNRCSLKSRAYTKSKAITP